MFSAIEVALLISNIVVLISFGYNYYKLKDVVETQKHVIDGLTHEKECYKDEIRVYQSRASVSEHSGLSLEYVRSLREEALSYKNQLAELREERVPEVEHNGVSVKKVVS